MNITEASFKKVINYDFQGNKLVFKVSQSLFGSQQVDVGTHHLLRSLVTNGYKNILDLGAGYGPIGISLKKMNPSAEVHMVDIDSLALDYCKENAELNGIEGLKIYASLGYDDVSESDFDLIISNIPAKIGDRAIEYIIQEAKHHLSKDGVVAIVVIDAIVDQVTGILESKDNIKIIYQKKWPGYTVFHFSYLKKNEEIEIIKSSAFDRGVFDREKVELKIGDSKVNLITTYGMGEFDTIRFDTSMALEKMGELGGGEVDRALVFNPGQGYLPVALVTLCQSNKLYLVDRNLLALRTTRRNLVKNGFPEDRIFLIHSSDLKTDDNEKIELIIGMLDEKNITLVNSAYLLQAAEKLSNDGVMILGSTSTVISRLDKAIKSSKNLSVINRSRKGGNSVIFLAAKATNL